MCCKGLQNRLRRVKTCGDVVRESSYLDQSRSNEVGVSGKSNPGNSQTGLIRLQKSNTGVVGCRATAMAIFGVLSDPVVVQG